MSGPVLPPTATTKREKPVERAKDQPKKLSYKDQRELDSLPGLIEKLEAAIEAIHVEMSAPEYFRRAGAEIAAKQAEESDLQQQLAAAYRRWEALES